MKKYKVAVMHSLMPAAQQKLSASCELTVLAGRDPWASPEFIQSLAQAEGLVAASSIPIDERLLAAAPNLRVIAQSAVGYDNIDIAACTRRRIPVGNTPGVLVDATADLTFALLLCAARRIHEGWDFVRSGQWSAGGSLSLGFDLAGKTLGIVGLGRIGAAVAKRAQAFGMNIVYHNRSRRSDDAALGLVYTDIDALLQRSDCIIVLSPLSDQTRGMFGAAQFAKMKPTAYFVNAARGAIVDTDALTAALTNGQIAFAAMDVTHPEPLPAHHPLLTLPNVLITPHIGSATVETRTAMALLTVDNLMAGLASQSLPACVNSQVNYI